MSRLSRRKFGALAGAVLLLVEERGTEPHIPVFHKSRRTDGTFSREDFRYDHRQDAYICPSGKELKRYRRAFQTPRSGVDDDGLMRYRARQGDCEACSLRFSS